MKLSFSTNGWSLGFSHLLELLQENKITGLEIHDVSAMSFEGEKPFSKSNINTTKKKLFEAGISISCIDVCSNLADASISNKCVAEVKEIVDLAQALSCKNVRIHAFECKDGGDFNHNVKNVIDLVIDYAKEKGVTLVMESMGIYSDTQKLADLLNDYACDNLSALWDIHHTHRYANEKPEISVKNLGKHIKHLHIKDSYIENAQIKYCLLGEGDLPIKNVFSSLSSINYEGYASLELMPMWLESLGDMDIILPQFTSYMGTFESVPSWQSTLYDNNAKTGKYVWKKETLIERTFSQVLDKMVEEFPDQLAFRYTTLDYTRTYSEFRDEVDVVARSLMALGVKAGDHVAVWATNVPEWYLTFWATAKIGAVLVTVNTAYKIH